jgi:hypothetical protein
MNTALIAVEQAGLPTEFTAMLELAACCARAATGQAAAAPPSSVMKSRRLT